MEGQLVPKPRNDVFRALNKNSRKFVRDRKHWSVVVAKMKLLAVPVLTRRRIWFALGVAAVTDFIQLALGPVGWLWVDQGLDVLAMLLTSAALGFHMLLLPTFVIEFFPLADMLPTWTACAAAVIMLRKKSQAQPPSPPQPPPGPPAIDVAAEVTRVPPRM